MVECIFTSPSLEAFFAQACSASDVRCEMQYRIQDPTKKPTMPNALLLKPVSCASQCFRSVPSLTDVAKSYHIECLLRGVSCLRMRRQAVVPTHIYKQRHIKAGWALKRSGMLADLRPVIRSCQPQRAALGHIILPDTTSPLYHFGDTCSFTGTQQRVRW